MEARTTNKGYGNHPFLSCLFAVFACASTMKAKMAKDKNPSPPLSSVKQVDPPPQFHGMEWVQIHSLSFGFPYPVPIPSAGATWSELQHRSELRGTISEWIIWSSFSSYYERSQVLLWMSSGASQIEQ
jgi:hypothetical protein